MLNKLTLMATCWLIGVMAIAAPAHAGTTFYFNENQPYRGYFNSPFAGSPGAHVETFEDGLLNTPRVTAMGGTVRGPSAATRSVDFDDGKVDGVSNTGRSYYSGNNKAMTFNFAVDSTGKRPSMAGLVWTAGAANSWVQLRAWDAFGAFIGNIIVRVGDLAGNNTTAHARFLGVSSDRGISRIQIASNSSGFQIDHLQFVYGFAVVPVPPALALGAAGLAGVMIWRKRFNKKTSNAELTADKRPSS